MFAGIGQQLEPHMRDGSFLTMGIVREEALPSATFISERLGRAYGSSSNELPGLTTTVEYYPWQLLFNG